MAVKSSSKPRYLPPLILLALVIIVVSILFAFPPTKLTSEKFSTSQSLVSEAQNRAFQGDTFKLPSPQKSGRVSLEQTLNQRRTKRAYVDKPLTLTQVSQLLWSAQGVTADWGGRTAPSAKNIYPLTIYLIALDVTGLEPGVYEYLPGDTTPIHELGQIKAGDFAEQVAEAGKQSQFKNPPIVLAIAGDFSKMSKAFDGQDANHNVYLEAGHAAQNIYLQAETLDLGTVATGGFDQQKTVELLQLPSSQTLIYLLPIGYPDLN